MSKIVLVTGATDGLGRGVARALATRGDTVIVHGRDRARTEALAKELGGRPYVADFTRLDEVRALGAAVLAEEPRLDVLVCNAGIGFAEPTHLPNDNEHRFQVNYLSHYLLTRLLLPLLQRSAPARIVNVSSAGQSTIDFDDLRMTRGFTPMRAYCVSKLAQILDTISLAEELAGKDVTVTALHPATFMATKMVGNPISTVEEGVAATMRLVVGPDAEGVTGRYFDGQHESRANAQAYDAKARASLRELSQKLTEESAPAAGSAH